MRIKIKTIETSKVVLRKINVSKDLISFNQYAMKPEIGTNAGWKPHESLNESLLILTQMRRSKEVWAIASLDNDEMIGTFSYKPIDNNKIEIGYALDSDYWNLGIMSEVVREVIKHLFSYKKVSEIIVGHIKENVGSKRVIEKNNFKLKEIIDYLYYDQTYKEAWFYSLRRDEYEKYFKY